MPVGRDPGRHLALCGRPTKKAMRYPARLPYTHIDINIDVKFDVDVDTE
ncbi:hypothetical protein ACFW5I_05130 [Streptomyces sp. NPDC058818]